MARAIDRLWISILLLPLVVLFSGTAAADHVSLDESGLLAHWQFDETEGDLRDWSGHAIDGVLSGGVQRGVAGVNNSSAYRFDGEDAMVEIDDPDQLLETREALSLEIWFRPDAVSIPDPTWLFKSADTSMYGMYLSPEGEISFYTDTGFDDGGWEKTTHELSAADTWYHVVGTYDGSLMELYVDGERVATRDQEGLINYHVGDPPVIGATTDDDGFFDGMIDMVRVYNRSLDPSEVETRFANPPGWHPSGTQSMTDDTTSNETSDDTANETDDGTMDNETASDAGSGDDSLFTGGNGTDTSSGSSTGDGTENETSNTSTSGQEDVDGSTNETDHTIDDGTEDADAEAEAGVSIRPDRFGFRVTAGEVVERTIQVQNAGPTATEVSVGTFGFPGVSVVPPSIRVGAGKKETVRILFNTSTMDPGRYSGVVRVESVNTARSLPVRFLVTANDTVEGHISIRVDEATTMTTDAFLSGEVRLYESPVPVNATIRSVVIDASGEMVAERRYDTNLVNDGGFPLSVSDVPTGNYTWNLTVRSPYETVSSSKRFVVREERFGSVEAPEGKGIDMVLVFLVVAAGIVAVTFYRYDVVDGFHGRVQSLMGREGGS